MLPDSGIGYEEWILIFVIGEPTDTAVVSQGHHSEPQSHVCSIVHCSCVGQHLTVLTLFWTRIPSMAAPAPSHHSCHQWSLCHPLSAGPKDTSLHPFSGAWLLWLSSPAYPCTHLSDMLPLAWGFPAVFCLSGTGSLPFLLAHRHACHHFSAIFPTFVLHVAILGTVFVVIFIFFFFLIGGRTLQQ